MNCERTEYEKFRTSLRKHGGWERWLYTIAHAARVKNGFLPRVMYTINHRSELWAEITEHARDGKVGYVVAGRDCDCTQYQHEGVMDLPAGAMLHQRSVDHHRDYLDGPESTYYRDPGEEVHRYQSRDLALEAFEDGHPHIVYSGELEEV
jgi:hypothetical protein